MLCYNQKIKIKRSLYFFWFPLSFSIVVQLHISFIIKKKVNKNKLNSPLFFR